MLFNVMLEDLPQEWNGYRIVPGFRIGIQITQILNDPECTDWERYALASELLFIDMPEDFQKCLEGITWFLGGWNLDHTEKSGKNDVTVIDFDIDQWRIHAAFLQQYRIDLSAINMHYWEFMGLLANLRDCRFTQVMEIRSRKETADMKPETKRALRKAKKIYNIRGAGAEDNRISPEREEFLKLAGLSK